MRTAYQTSFLYNFTGHVQFSSLSAILFLIHLSYFNLSYDE